MKVKYELVFDRKKEIQKKGKGLVQIQAYLDGARRYFSTRLHLTQKEWDDKKNTAKDPYTARMLREKIGEFENFEIHYRATHKKFSLDDFKHFLKSLKPAKKVDALSFTEFYRQQLAKQPQLAKATIVTHTVTFNNLCAFKKQVEFEDLTYSFLQDFDIFLRKKGKHINTIEKYHRHLRKYINLAILHDLLAEDKNPYRKFKLVTEPTDALFLLPEQRKRIEMLEFTPEQKELEMARDMFLFSCYTGLRHCDSYALTREKVVFTEEGEGLKYQSIKTGKWDYKPLFLLFDGAPARILNKYLPQRNKVRIFKGMSSQKVNKLLKIIAVMADVDPRLYFKASRDTFGTNLYMLSGDAKLVQLQLQHSKREQTDKYVHAIEQVQNEALKKIFKQNSPPANDGGAESGQD
ncbi:site-specific integrase [Runella rosea]|uniref:Site-specific integrase n=1 Tax=Runella rosea TaxID=2259595 RepID=A0A344TDI1_9BACT|nr:site-specific integrase [Runella rosea]AXE16702.1 site-specific integrase [Runella rosea]